MNTSPSPKKKHLPAALAAVLLMAAGPAAAELPQYTVVSLSGWWNAGAYNAVSLNDLGEILIRSMGAEKEFALVKDGVRTASLTNPPAGYDQFDGGRGLNNAGLALADLDSLTSEGVGIADMRTGIISALPGYFYPVRCLRFRLPRDLLIWKVPSPSGMPRAIFRPLEIGPRCRQLSETAGACAV